MVRKGGKLFDVLDMWVGQPPSQTCPNFISVQGLGASGWRNGFGAAFPFGTKCGDVGIEQLEIE
jgi:hypothetical protein